MENVIVKDNQGTERTTFFNNESFTIDIDYTNPGGIDKAVVGIAIYRDDKTLIYGTNTLIDMAKQIKVKDKGTISLKIDSFPVNAGNYIFDLAFHKPDGFNYDFWRDVFRLKINNAKDEVGVVSISHSWESDS